MKRRVLIAAIMFLLFMPLGGCMSAPYKPPASNPCMPVSIPFPITSGNVEITTSMLTFDWEEADYAGVLPCAYNAEFTILYTGSSDN